VPSINHCLLQLCAAAINIFEFCAFNPEFQHFIPIFNKKIITLQITLFKRLKEGLGDETKTQRVGDWDTLRISLLCCVLFEVLE